MKGIVKIHKTIKLLVVRNVLTIPFKNIVAIFSLLFMFFSLPATSFSQTFNPFDTLDKAKNLIADQRISEAVILLTQLEKQNKGDEDVIILLSQALYWNQDFDNFLKYYKKTIKSYPQSENLKIHFGRILFELNHLDEAKKILTSYAEANPRDVENNILLATIAYWQGDPPQIALEFLENVLDQYPTHKEALALRKEIAISTAPRLNFTTSLYSDSQPLQALINTVELSNYYSSWLQPSVLFQNRNFNQADPTLFFQLSNKSIIIKSKTEIHTCVGLFNDSWHSEFSPTWGLDLIQETLNKLYLSGGIDKRPYVFTLASLNQNLMPTSYTAGINRQGELWTARLSFQHMQFEDDNYVQTGSMVFLIPIIISNSLHVNIGYSYMMADSKENRFRLAEPVAAKVSETDIGTNFPGIFDPYFTPENQKVHSLITEIALTISPKISWSINANVGVHATIDNPNVIFYGASDPYYYSPEFINPVNPNSLNPSAKNDLIDPADIYRVLIPTEYFPMDLKSTLNWKMTKNLYLKTEYAYQRAVFFDSHLLSLGLNWNLTNE